MKRMMSVLALIFLLPGAIEAGGTVTFEVHSNNPNDARRIRTGLVLYQMYRDIESNGHISQNGWNNAAGLVQTGRSNVGIIQQNGNGHRGTLIQNGNRQSCGVFQSGRNTRAYVNQRRNGAACLVFQHGF